MRNCQVGFRLNNNGWWDYRRTSDQEWFIIPFDVLSPKEEGVHIDTVLGRLLLNGYFSGCSILLRMVNNIKIDVKQI